MLKFLPYIAKNLLGHRVRTLMTVGGTALLMFLFLFIASVQGGLDRLLESGEGKLIVFQAYRFCPSSSQLPVYYDDIIRGVPGVRDVLPIKVVVNNCRASLETVMFHGVDPKRLPISRSHFRFAGDGWSAFTARDDAALVGRRIADRRGLKAGQTFSAAGVTVTVADIFSSDRPGEENIIYTHLPLLLLGKHHDDYHVTLFEVIPDEAINASRIAEAIDAKIRDRGQVPTETKPQNQHAQSSLGDLLDLIALTRWLGAVCIGVVVILVANAVVMAAQDRVKEHAVLQTIGYTGLRIGGMMLAESTLISLLGGVIGIGACVAWIWWRPLSLSTEGATIDFTASWRLTCVGIILAGLVGLLGGAIPAWQAGRSEIVASLR